MISLHRFAYVVLTVVYFVLLMAVFCFFKNDVFGYSIWFLFINFVLSSLFYKFIQFDGEYVYAMIFYLVFFFVYVGKAIVQYILGLESAYVIQTVGTIISTENYIISLEYVTMGHMIVLICLLVLGLLKAKVGLNSMSSRLKKSNVNYMLLFITVFTIVSSVVMFEYGVAVMGREGVSLPFKLSGIFFYSRTILIPMLLLFLIKQALYLGDGRLFKKVILIFLLLATCEVITRATKAPFFLLMLEILILYLLLLSCGIQNIKFKARYLFILLMLAISLWPIVEAYRSIMVSGEAAVIVDKDQNALVYSITRLTQRLLGFLQFSGLIVDREYSHDVDVIFSFDSFARYYTQSYLGLTNLGHLSSPSLLGVVLILGGGYWYAFIPLFVLVAFFAWRAAEFFRYMCIPVKCLVGVQLINMIMAGTIDFFIYNVTYIYAVAIIVECVFALSVRRKVEAHYSNKGP